MALQFASESTCYVAINNAMNETTVGHIAKVITKCYSPQSLVQVAIEMGEPIALGEDLFQALIHAGRASDLETAVILVACHLDGRDSQVDEAPTFLQDRRAK